MPAKRQSSTRKRETKDAGNYQDKQATMEGQPPLQYENNNQQLMPNNTRTARFHRSEDSSLQSNHVLQYLERATSAPALRSLTSTDSTVLLTELSCEETVCDQSVEEMMNLFQRNHRNVHLTVLRLPRNHLTTAAARPLANILQFTETLMVLDIRSNKVGSEGVEALVKPLIERGDECSLVSLNLADNNLGAKAANSIAQLLRLNKTIREIDLGQNQFRSKGMKLIAKGIEDNSTLHTLTLSHNQGSTGTQNIMKALQENQDTKIHTLDISANKLGGTGAGVKALRELLIRNKTIRTLNLSSNSLKSAGILEFAPALKLPNMLLDLNLSQNEIGNEGVIGIANFLLEDGMEHGHCYLSRLSLEWSQITDDGAIYLARCLEKNTKLTYLNLAHNHIGSSGAKAYAKLFSINFTLKEVLFHDNNIDDECIDDLTASLGKKDCRIENFTWHDNALLSSKGEFKLAHVFEYRESLKTWLNVLDDNLRHDRAMSVNWWNQPPGIYSQVTYTDLEVTFLAHSLRKYNPERLQSIYLTGQHISEKSIVDLCEFYLAEDPSLQRLYIKRVSLGGNGVNAISQALCTNSTLKILSVTNCGLTALACGTLAISLKHNSTLQRLSLQGNDIRDEGFRMLWDIIRRPHPSLTALNVSSNNLTDESMANLFGSVEGLQELYLDGNQITDRGALDLSKSIMDHEALKFLSVGNNAQMTNRGKSTLRLFAPNRLSL